MRINDLEIDGFGIWKGLKVDGASPAMTVFYGRNEAGKTTLMQFIRAMLFGFSPERRSRYLPPVYGGQAGGAIHVLTERGDFEIRRHVDPQRVQDPQGDLVVTGGRDGEVHGRAALTAILSDVDEPIFSNVFAIGLQEIQELGALSGTDAAELLYRLTSGVDRVSLVDVMRQVARQRQSLWSTANDQPSLLTDLSERRRTLGRHIEQLVLRGRRWSKLTAESEDISHQLTALDGQLERLEQDRRRVELALQIADRWKARVALDQQITGLGNLPDPRQVDAKQYDEASATHARLEERLAQLDKQRSEIRKQAGALPIQRLVAANAARIDALVEHLPWIESIRRQTERLGSELADLNSAIAEQQQGLGSQLELSGPARNHLPQRLEIGLRNRARRLAQRRQDAHDAAEAVAQAELEWNQFDEHLRGAHQRRDDAGLSLDDTSRRVQLLRRRVDLEEKADKLNRARADLERDIDEIVANQVLPVNKLTLLGIIFIIGIVLLGFGLLRFSWTGGSAGSTETEIGFVLMLLGTGCGLFAFGLKHHWERLAREQLDDFQHQFDLVRQQLSKVKRERDEIERQLPESAGQWTVDLQDAEGKLARLEELVPLERRCQAARARYEEAKLRQTRAAHELAAAEQAWRADLRAAGLPETLDSGGLKEIAVRTQRIAGLESRRAALVHELESRQRELEELDRRIARLLDDVGLKFASRDPAERLEQLRGALADQRRLMRTRQELADKYRELRGAAAKTRRDLRRVQNLRQRLLDQAGADSADELRGLHARLIERRRLAERRAALTEQIAAALGGQMTEDELEQFYESRGGAGLEPQWERIESEITALKNQQARLHEQRGELLKEVKLMAEDTELEEARLELASLDVQIARAKRQWQVVAATSLLLEHVREKYEAERQPETLREASAQLVRLTEGAYQRIWTRMVGEELVVDNAAGDTLPMDLLSRGTREAVYLSLRLALVTAYARRGIVLPLVLDDVLVNFDVQRARAAATVLCEFARSGYQILMFTCHDHMRDLMAELGVDVRILPHHKDAASHGAVPTPYRLPTATPVPVVELIDHEDLAIVDEPTELEPIELAQIDFRLNEHDPDLEYELAAIDQDQRRQRRWETVS